MARTDDVDPADHTDHIRYVPVGFIFKDRKELAEARVHPSLENGIYRGPIQQAGVPEPAKSIVMSNRPEYPNEDSWETFTYIGMGGRGSDDDEEKSTHGGPQTADQSFDHPMNKALQVAQKLGTSVRVTRGAGASEFAPPKGYRYDGLYNVVDSKLEKGPSGFLVCKFYFKRETGQVSPPTDRGPEPETSSRGTRSPKKANLEV